MICLSSAALWSCFPQDASHAQSFFWTGDGSTNVWSNANNWGGVVPTSGSANLFFLPVSSRYSSFNNLGTFDLELLFLSASTPYTISGNTLRFSATTPELDASGGAQTINNPIVITQPLEVQVNSGASLDLNGNLSGSADITKINGGLLIIDGADNSGWLGDLNIQAGTVRFATGDTLSAVTDVHVAAGATADFSPQGEAFGGFSGAGHIEIGNTVNFFSNFTTNASFSGSLSGANAHFLKQGPGTLSLTSGADVSVDQITVEGGAISVGDGATVTTGDTNVELGSTLSLSANSNYHSDSGFLVLGTLTTSGGDISIGQFTNITIREFGIWNLDDLGDTSTTFTEAILNVNDSAVLRMFGDVTLDRSFLNIEDTDLFELANTGVDILAENISSLTIGALTGMQDSNTLDLDSNSTITLNSGSMLRTNWIRLGFADSQASITMDGAGTLIDAPYAVDVGYDGPGELTISGGAQVESFFGAVGRNTGGSGLLTITGTDPNDNPSSWVVESNLNIGLFNLTTGEVHVLEGAELSADQLTVGSGGDGSLTIESGGSVSNSSAFLGRIGNATGTVTVTGTDSTWTNSGELTVGFVGDGSLTIEAGGSVISNGGTLAVNTSSSGTVTVTGAGSSWTNSGELRVGVVSDGSLTISAGAAVSSLKGTIGSGLSSTSAVTITGAGSTWTNTDFIIVGDQGMATLMIDDGGSVTSNSTSSIGLQSGSVGTVVVASNGSVWTNDGALSIGGDVISGTNGGEGMLSIQPGGTASITGNTTLFPDSLLSLEGGTLTTSMITFEGGGAFDWSSGTLHVGIFDGDLTNPTGGTLSPGESAGSTVVLGDYAQHVSATLLIEIGGTSPGGTHDLVNITGSAVLGGELRLAMLDGFLPDPNHTFTVFTAAGGILGVFSNITTGLRLETTDGIGSFQVNYGVDSEFDETQIVLSRFQLSQTFAADFDEDGDVDNVDLGIWESAYGATNLADADGDDDSDGLDFLQWQKQFTGSLPLTAAAVVPEPSTLLLALAGTTLLSCARRITNIASPVSQVE